MKADMPILPPINRFISGLSCQDGELGHPECVKAVESKNLLVKILEVWDDPGIQGEFYLVEELSPLVKEIRAFLELED